MPYLMVNLEDPADCRKAMQHLRGIVNPGGKCGPENGPRGGRQGGTGHRRGLGRGGHGPNDLEPGIAPPAADGDDKAAAIRALPLRAKLERMSQRGVWRHLVSIAKQGDVSKSLGELDQQLDLQPNKMRSLKAIMAKLENRFDLRFLEVDVDAGNDDAGNPRYAMPPRVRKQILRIISEA
ncbi:MAG: hypothetical protein SGI77_26000 [Pirellulaceae bacterium]|nr:hypothetical protein [Pirellulaceae bacterium]